MDNALIGILDLCLAIDKVARDVYRRFADGEEKKEPKAFWQQMASDEETHLAYWERLLSMAREGMVPQVFDDPQTVKEELTSVLSGVEALAQDRVGLASPSRAFLTAFRLEFYLLHPAFAALLRVLRDVLKEDAEEKYEEHVNRLMGAVGQCGPATPELELIASALQRLWRQNRLLQEQSCIDPLTSLRNRRGLYQAMVPLAHLAKRNKRGVGVLMIDIDNFKGINDGHGHTVGDKVLKAVAGVLESVVRRSDLAARLGGDEFVVFLSDVRPEYVEEVAERVRRSVEAAGCGGLPVTACVGASHAVPHGEVTGELEMLFQEADACLYQAKHKGRNAVVVNRGGASLQA